jgi:short-subunit dehydrogenase
VPAFAKAGPKALILVARNATLLREVETVVRSTNPEIEVVLIPASISDKHTVAALYESV